MLQLKKIALATVIALGALATAQSQAGVINYATGNSNPWGSTTTDAAMTQAFGANNWVKSNGFSLDVFNNASFVYLDGSDGNANQFSSFITSNKAQIESYVFNGGRLFLNAAPNQGSSFDMGFGVHLNYTAYSRNAYVTDEGVAAGLTAGNLTRNYTGNYFSHASVNGPISNLIQGDAGTIFGGMRYGQGYVAFGGQTTTNWHSPNPDAQNLLANEFKYTANVAPVPEPETYALMGMGLVGLIAARRRKLKQA